MAVVEPEKLIERADWGNADQESAGPAGPESAGIATHESADHAAREPKDHAAPELEDHAKFVESGELQPFDKQYHVQLLGRILSSLPSCLLGNLLDCLLGNLLDGLMSSMSSCVMYHLPQGILINRWRRGYTCSSSASLASLVVRVRLALLFGGICKESKMVNFCRTPSTNA